MTDARNLGRLHNEGSTAVTVSTDAINTVEDTRPKLSAVQYAYWKHIIQFCAEHTRPPSTRELAAFTGKSRTTAHAVITRLTAKGYLQTNENGVITVPGATWTPPEGWKDIPHVI